MYYRQCDHCRGDYWVNRQQEPGYCSGRCRTAAHRLQSKSSGQILDSAIVTWPHRRRREKPRPIIPYPGGKWYGKRLILPKFPPLVSEMVSPFLGGGSIELSMAARGCRVYASDIYEPLTNLYHHALSCPNALADAVQRLHPMPKNRFIESLSAHLAGDGDPPLERAARWYALIRSSYSGRIIEYTVGNYSGHRLRFTQRMIDKLRAFRAPTLSVATMDWRDALDDRPEMFAYLDPPYPKISRTLYANHREFDHIALRDYLAKRQGPWALSINNLPVTRDLYQGLNLHSLTWRQHIGGGNLGLLQELLVTNY